MFANVTSFAKFAKISSREHFHAYGIYIHRYEHEAILKPKTENNIGAPSAPQKIVLLECLKLYSRGCSLTEYVWSLWVTYVNCVVCPCNMLLSQCYLLICFEGYRTLLAPLRTLLQAINLALCPLRKPHISILVFGGLYISSASTRLIQCTLCIYNLSCVSVRALLALLHHAVCLL